MNSNPVTEKAIVFQSGEAKANLVIEPEGTPVIGDEAFADRADLTTIIIPGSVKSIGSRAFANCARLTTVVLLEGVIRIGNHAFEGCTNLKSITIPDSIAEIGLFSFVGCRSLTDIWASLPLLSKFQNSLSMTPWGAGRVQWGVNRLPDETVCITGAHHSGQALVIPEEIYGHMVSQIGTRAFYGQEGISSVTVPETVKSIGASAFQNCRNLNELILSEGLEQVGERAFANCPLLSTLFIPNSVRMWGPNAVCHCPSLTQVSLSEYVLRATAAKEFDDFMKNKNAVLEVRMSTESAERYSSYQSFNISSTLMNWIKNGYNCRIETGNEELNQKLNRMLNSQRRVADLKGFAFMGALLIAFLFFIVLWIDVFFIKDNTLLWICWAGMVIFFGPILIASVMRK